jgi:hypothetical protein
MCENPLVTTVNFIDTLPPTFFDSPIERHPMSDFDQQRSRRKLVKYLHPPAPKDAPLHKKIKARRAQVRAYAFIKFDGALHALLVKDGLNERAGVLGQLDQGAQGDNFTPLRPNLWTRKELYNRVRWLKGNLTKQIIAGKTTLEYAKQTYDYENTWRETKRAYEEKTQQRIISTPLTETLEEWREKLEAKRIAHIRTTREKLEKYSKLLVELKSQHQQVRRELHNARRKQLRAVAKKKAMQAKMNAWFDKKKAEKLRRKNKKATAQPKDS